MKGRGGYGYGSSRTSVDEEPEPQSRDWKEVGNERGGWLRQQMAGMTEREHGTSIPSEPSNNGPDPLVGAHSFEWARRNNGRRRLVAWRTVGSRVVALVTRRNCRKHTYYKRTKSMGIQHCCTSGRACVLFLFLRTGEMADSIIWHAGTPPGEESRLTRALKAYHIDKARDPTDLPEWLFEEHERRPIGRSGTRFRYREDNDEDGGNETRSNIASTQPRAGGTRGLRDVYDAAAATTRQQETLRESPSRGRLLQQRDDVSVGSAAPTSKAHDRLKALRDAKRRAAQRNTSVSSIDLSGRASVLAEREERGRSYGRQGDGPHRRAPSLPASVRPPHNSGLPPRPDIRRI
jgi:hypothetical protein